MTAVAERTQAQEAPHFHQGMIALYGDLAERYGTHSVKAGSLAIGLDQGIGTFELHVPLDQINPAT